jgi:mannose-6-phosphate isomerase-like protein (cupin superfamily)
MFNTKRLPQVPDAIAPDGCHVRLLLSLARGGLAHFELPAGQTSIAVAHRTVEEIWYFLDGKGEMWRKSGDHQETVAVEAGVSLTIPLGTHFQFRSTGKKPLQAIGVTMPPWPGEGEAFEVKGNWPRN